MVLWMFEFVPITWPQDNARHVFYQQTYTALYTFIAEDETQLSLEPGQIVVPLLKDSFEEWWFVKADNGKQGYVPAAYLRREVRSNTKPAPSQ